MKHFVFAFHAYRQALQFTNHHSLWGYYIVPALLNLALFGGLGYVFWLLGASVTEGMENLLPADWLQHSWGNILQTALKTLIYLILLVFYIKIYRFLMLLLLSPALALYSERIQEIWHGKTPRPFDWGQLRKDSWRGLQLNLRNLATELSLTIILLLIGLVFSFLSPLVTVCLLIVEAYFIGFSMIDYRNEYVLLAPNKSRQLVWFYRFFAIGIGLVFLLLLWIPILGALFAPFLAITAAGIGMNELEKDTEF